MYGSRAPILIRTLLVLVVYAAAIYWLDRLLFSGSIGHRPLALALAFAIVQSVAIVVMLGVLLTRRGLAQRRARRSRRLASDAHAAVAAHAAGQDRLRALLLLQSESRHDVAVAVASFLGATRGTMHERVLSLARDLGISEKEAREGRTIERAAAGSLYDRALIAGEMQAHAERIAEHEIPRALATGDEQQSIAALDLLRAWQRALPVHGFEQALAHPSAEVRSRAFAVIPYVQPSRVARIAEGLRDGDPRVRKAAAEAAAKTRDTEAVPQLERVLHDEHRDVATAAAFALASTGEGLAVLQRSHDAVAFEALEKATLGRLA